MLLFTYILLVACLLNNNGLQTMGIVLIYFDLAKTKEDFKNKSIITL